MEPVRTVRDTLDFYRRNPFVLAIALLVGAALVLLVLIDGNGLGLGEIVAVVASGAILGVVVGVTRQRRT